MKLRHCNQLKKCLPITCTISISLKKLNEETRKSRDDTVFREIKTVLSPCFLLTQWQFLAENYIIERSVKIHQTTQFRLNNLKTLLQYQGTLNPNQSRNRYLFSSSKEKLVMSIETVVLGDFLHFFCQNLSNGGR